MRKTSAIQLVQPVFGTRKTWLTSLRTSLSILIGEFEFWLFWRESQLISKEVALSLCYLRSWGLGVKMLPRLKIKQRDSWRSGEGRWWRTWKTKRRKDTFPASPRASPDSPGGFSGFLGFSSGRSGLFRNVDTFDGVTWKRVAALIEMTYQLLTLQHWHFLKVKGHHVSQKLRAFFGI